MVVRFIPLILLAGCSWIRPDPIVRVEVREVPIPYAVPCVVPEWMREPHRPERLPQFISPDHPDAFAALSEEQLDVMREILRTLRLRDRACAALSD
jgi:hypothetical protein